MCNFPDQYAFSKQFKKATGSSPTETRHGYSGYLQGYDISF
jgi:AraC-like DNA-binding protein